MDIPVVYFKPGCPFGIKLRAALRLHGVSHRAVRFRDDEVGAARVRALNGGNEMSPTVSVSGRWLTNPGWREVHDAALSHTVNDTHPSTGARQGARQSAWRSAAVTLSAVSTLLVGCGSGDSASTTAAPDKRPSAPASAPATSDSPPTASPEPSPAPARSPLEGAWQTRPVTPEETEATLRKHGLGRWVADYRKNAPFSGETVLTLTIEGGAWDLYGASDGGAPQPIDYDAEYEIDGDTVTFHHSDGSTTYRWKVLGDTLRLRWARSTMPDYEGIPDEVFQRALYMTATFSRQP